jgi:hypothetical protein
MATVCWDTTSYNVLHNGEDSDELAASKFMAQVKPHGGNSSDTDRYWQVRNVLPMLN